MFCSKKKNCNVKLVFFLLEKSENLFKYKVRDFARSSRWLENRTGSDCCACQVRDFARSSRWLETKTN